MNEADPDFAMAKIFALGMDCFGEFFKQVFFTITVTASCVMDNQFNMW